MFCCIQLNEGSDGRKERLQWPLLHLVMAIQVSCSAVTLYVYICVCVMMLGLFNGHSPFVYCYLNGYVNCVTYGPEFKALYCKLEVSFVNVYV